MKEKRKIKGQLGRYLQWPLFLGILVVLMNVVVGAMDIGAGLAMCVFTLLYLGIAVVLYTYKRKGLLAGMVEFSADYAWIQKKLLADLDVKNAQTEDLLHRNKNLLVQI